jgi:hypothetical protein
MEPAVILIMAEDKFKNYTMRTEEESKGELIYVHEIGPNQHGGILDLQILISRFPIDYMLLHKRH